MSEKCQKIHSELNKMKRMDFPFDHESLPKNGVYLLFEKGEFSHGEDRIVRVGTHTGEGSLRARLLDHYIKGFKDRNIFRKNIGRAILFKDGDNYLEKWNLNLRSKENREKYLPLIDLEYEKELEGIISDYIQNNISFVVVEESDKDKRLILERNLIAEISSCKDCGPSEIWLGRHSPIKKISDSGLWQVNELYKEGFNRIEFYEFLETCLRTKIHMLID